jgi:hypothetical protein
MAVVILASVLVGFAHSYYLVGGVQAPMPNLLVHIHVRWQSRLEKKMCLRNGFEKPNFGPWDFQVTAEKAMQSRTWLEG